MQLACLVVAMQALSKYDQPLQPRNGVHIWHKHVPLKRKNAYIPPHELLTTRNVATELAEVDGQIWQKNAMWNRNLYVPSPEPPQIQNMPTELAELDGQLEMSAQALELALTSTARIRHIVSAAYRQIKLNNDTPFASAIQKSIETYTEQMSDQSAALGAPDQYMCESLMKKSLEYLSTFEKKELNEYLDWINPGSELAAREIKGCFTEKVLDPNATFQRLFLKLGNIRVENLIVKALTAAGNEEIYGTRQEGTSEASARDALKNYVNGQEVITAMSNVS